MTFNLQVLSNNTTVVNNYIQQVDKKLNTLEKVASSTQGNVTQVETNINKTLAISKTILNEVD